MIEFGAGGQIVQQNDPVPTTAPAAAADGDIGETAETPSETNAAAGEVDAEPSVPATTTPEAPQMPTPIPTVVPTTNNRRKRKAKGWFCPVCRQRTFLIHIEEVAAAKYASSH